MLAALLSDVPAGRPLAARERGWICALVVLAAHRTDTVDPRRRRLAHIRDRSRSSRREEAPAGPDCPYSLGIEDAGADAPPRDRIVMLMTAA